MDNLFRALKACGDEFHTTSFTIVDMQKDDRPLMYVNQHFVKMTGYPIEEILHRNCRFLQSGKSDQSVLRPIRSCLKAGVASYHDLVNYKKNGTAFWNRLCLFPIQHEVIGLKYFVGIQLDVTEHKKSYAPQQAVNFIENTELSQHVHDRIENPLEKLIHNSSALKYFHDDDPESLVQRKQIAVDTSFQVQELTQYVASLKV